MVVAPRLFATEPGTGTKGVIQMKKIKKGKPVVHVKVLRLKYYPVSSKEVYEWKISESGIREVLIF
jgi:hypothetical protein